MRSLPRSFCSSAFAEQALAFADCGEKLRFDFSAFAGCSVFAAVGAADTGAATGAAGVAGACANDAPEKHMAEMKNALISEVTFFMEVKTC